MSALFRSFQVPSGGLVIAQRRFRTVRMPARTRTMHTNTIADLDIIVSIEAHSNQAQPYLRCTRHAQSYLRVGSLCGAAASSNPKSLVGQCIKSPTASSKAALRRWKNGVHPAGRRVPWPADLRTTAASSTDAVLEIISIIGHHVRNYQGARNPQTKYGARATPQAVQVVGSPQLRDPRPPSARRYAFLCGRPSFVYTHESAGASSHSTQNS